MTALLAAPAAAWGAAGDINTVAGNGTSGHSGDGGTATSAGFAYPTAVLAAAGGTLYVSDYLAHRVRRVSSGNTISTFAGTGSAGFSGDTGAATSAQVANPAAIAIDSAGNVYIADSANRRIRRVAAADGRISTVAGTGSNGWSGDGGQAVLATLSTPVGLEFDNAGNLLVADVGNHTIRRITPTGTISTVAGTGSAGYSGDGGAAASAQLSEPRRVAVDRNGNLYITDTANARIRRVTPGGTISTWAGTGVAGYSGNGGQATSAQINRPTGLEVDSASNVFIAEEGNDVIRKITAAGVISRVAGIQGSPGYSGDTGQATSAQINDPRGISIEADGDVVFADSANFRVRRITRIAAPAAPTVTGTTPASPGTAESIQVRGTAEAGFTVRLYTTSDCSGGAVATGTAAAFASPGLSVTVPSDSTRTFHATATDSFGTVSGCSRTSVTYVEDSTAPAAPTIDTAPASPGSGRSPQWSFTAEGGATIECKLTSGSGDTLSAWGTCTSPKSYSLAGQPDGTYTIAVRARDAAGNQSLESTSSFMLDTTAPNPPSIDTQPTSPGTGRNPSFSFTGEGGAALSCRLVRGGDTIEDWTPCNSGSKGYDLDGQADGTYAFSVRATDGAGNTGTPATANYTLDTTAPAAPSIGAPPSSPGNDLSPEWGWTGEDGASFRCRMEYEGSEIQAWTACTSPYPYDLSGEPDGAYTFQVHGRDAAGNDGPAASHTYTLNTALPATPTIDTAEPSPGNDENPQWAFSTSEGGVTLECRLDRGVDTVYDWEACTTSQSFDLTSEPDGDYTFSVRADNGITQGAPATAAYTLDTAAPGDPTFPSVPASPDRDTAPEWTLAATGGATRFECRLVRGPDTVAARANCTTPASWNLGSEPDGSYVLEGRAFDAAGNASGWAASAAYVLDTTPPPAPTVAPPATPSSDATPTWTFSAAGAAGYECRVEREALVVDDWATCASPWTYDLDGAPDGVYTVLVRSRDAVGNRSGGVSSTYELDRSIPATPAITATPGPLGSGTAPEWSFNSSESGVTFECRLARGADEIDPWGACSSPKPYSLAGEDDGEYTFSLRAKNAVGTVGAAATSVYELDTTAPAAPAVGSEPAAVGSGRAPAWSFTAEPGAATECRVARGATEVSGWSACASPHTVDLGGQPDGTYTLSLRARDGAGNVGPAATRSYELDTTGPAAPAFTAPAVSPGNSRQPSWSWDAAAGVTYECSLARPGDAADPWAPCTSPVVRDLTGQPDGRYELRVRAIDAAANAGTAATAAYDLDTQPGALTMTGGPGGVSRDASLTWTWDGEAGASFRCRTLRDDTVRTDWAACSSPHTVDAAGDSDGSYSFEVAATDAAGNGTAPVVWRFAIDRTPPAAAAYEATPPARARDRTPEWSFASEPGARYECRVERGATLLADWHACVSPLKVDLREREDGSYTLLVRAFDEAGNAAAPVATAYRLDTTDPDPPALTSTPGAAGDDRTPTWAFRSEPRAELECRLKRDGLSAPAWRACESPKTYDLESEPDDGYTFSVRARDVAGNTGEPASHAYRLRRASAADGGSAAGGGGAPQPGAGVPAPPAPGAAPADPAPGAAPSDDADAQAGDDRSGDAKDAGASGGRGDGAAAGARPDAGAAGGPGAASAADGEGRNRPRKKGNVAQETFKKVGKVVAVIAESPEKGVFPMSLIFIVAGFMGLQGRIDRNDPKLALAPVFADPDLEFRPPRAARVGMET